MQLLLDNFFHLLYVLVDIKIVAVDALDFRNQLALLRKQFCVFLCKGKYQNQFLQLKQ